jgi:hypothetical protein
MLAKGNAAVETPAASMAEVGGRALIPHQL